MLRDSVALLKGGLVLVFLLASPASAQEGGLVSAARSLLGDLERSLVYERPTPPPSEIDRHIASVEADLSALSEGEIPGPPRLQDRQEDPWSLDEMIHEGGMPEWLRVWGAVQLRFEALDGQFRVDPSLDRRDAIVSLRTVLAFEADFDDVAVLLEGQDSRVLGAGSGSAISTADVNAVELLQAALKLRLGSFGELTFGRQTMDIGSRRLIARNRYRNTINAFTGLRWDWEGGEKQVTAFATLPVRRLPEDRASLVDNEIEFDDEDFDESFFGLFFSDALGEDARIELYGFGLLESGDDTLGRRFGTIGARLHRAPAVGAFDYEIEAIVQFGASRPRRNQSRLDHFAGFLHAHLAFTFRGDWSPRVRLSLDIASGDSDPNDGDNNRFDSLFGAPTEYGPTGLYGFFFRQNFVTPEVRFECDPLDNLHLRLFYRPAWLESRRGGGGSALIQDPTGDSGRFIGHQLEAYLRWRIPSARLQIEAGIVQLFGGRFLEDAPTSRTDDSTYGYLQFVWTF